MDKKQITVTSPLLPDLKEFNELLAQIWDSKWITNNGSFHRQLETSLTEYLKVPYVSLFTNGTLPLLTALQAHVAEDTLQTGTQIALYETGLDGEPEARADQQEDQNVVGQIAVDLLNNGK